MELHQIRYFLAVAETLNFTRAADLCNVAQPSLSKAVRKLEEELGGALFRRERNQTHLTDLGRDMHPLLRQASESAAAAKAHAASLMHGQHLPMRIGVSETVNPDLMIPVLVALVRAFAGVRLHLARADADRLLEALREGEIELLVAAEIVSDWDRLDHWPLFEEGFVLAGSPDWPRTAITISKLNETGLIARQHCETLRARAVDLPPALADCRQIHEVSCDADAAMLANSGIGIAILPESAARRLSKQWNASPDIALTREVSVYAVAGRQRSAAANGLLKLLRSADWAALLN